MKRFFHWLVQVVRAILRALNNFWISLMVLAAIGIIAVIIASRWMPLSPEYYLGGMVAVAFLFLSYIFKFGWTSGQQDRQLVKSVEAEHAASEEATLNTWGTGIADGLRSVPFGIVCLLLGGAFMYFAGFYWPVIFP